MNRLQNLFASKDKDILNIYFTAGYPELHDTQRILRTLDNNKVDIIEIGMPYSDPMADGSTIQASGAKALANGMQLEVLFDQVEAVRSGINASLILMGYYNQVLQYGAEAFFRRCKEVGIDGLIIPDLPLHEYEKEYKDLFVDLDLGISFLITPQTPEQRMKLIDKLTRGFIYMVSSASITGTSKDISNSQLEYFQKVQSLNLLNPRLIGFGISDHRSFSIACKYAHGAIIGSAFIKELIKGEKLEASISQFIQGIKAPIAQS